MARQAELLGIAHNIADHAISPFGYLSPHMANALRSAGLSTTTVELLDSSPYPKGAAASPELVLALTALHVWTVELFAKHGFDRASVESVQLSATPAPWDNSGCALHARAIIRTPAGREYDSGWLQ